MNKKILFALSFVFALIGFSSCSENVAEEEYENWRPRNEHFIDSIASLARSGKDGWEMIKSYNLSDSLGKNGQNIYYIYVQKLEKGTGETYPEYNDSIRMHYLGRLLPSKSYASGYLFDKSYSGTTLNEQTDVPALFGVNKLASGIATAVMNMVVNDRWKVVVPYYLGYGTSGDQKIPGYSALIFDIKLARIYKYKIDKNTTWW
ncbi:MAG: FKBP-type peptidyl-prolyl cis-trans isomerase [Bacteroidaceae bacterium]|jgi:FKBP-type peptidyl-prolyl cis-trans isomerase FklB|nr:FKBP-type peptidyl-prolyl cis-trans isomerase [Bacteroidaceae bacterium]